MSIDDAVGEVLGVVVRHAGGFMVDMAAQHIFSRYTARFFHGVGRRVIAVLTLGRKRIPSSLRMVPKGAKPKPRGSDWLALWTGIAFWIALFFAIGLLATHFL
ncbi:hypothetical protein [Sphingobium sp.]|uniref:hypothetical protein n=1 Tax=Sphingobium sp. TaxID=1912891 RepID=UPI003BB4995A